LFSGLKAEEAYFSLQIGLDGAFSRLYTKLRSSGSPTELDFFRARKLREDDTNANKLSFTKLIMGCGQLIRWPRVALPFAVIGLFHRSNREAYNDDDVKITYALFVCGTVIEVTSLYILLFAQYSLIEFNWPGTVAQYSLIGFFARNKEHRRKMGVVSFFGCKEYLDQQWCMKSCISSGRIALLVLQYLKDGWIRHIQGVGSYWKFDDHRGQGTLERHQCNEVLGWSLKGRVFFCGASPRISASTQAGRV
jgi:hypothetical protein